MNTAMIGKEVTVTIDRPLGSRYPRFDMIYPINYGYVEGIIGGDQEEQDAYIVGVQEPVTAFTGKIIAVVERYDDCETKWVVAPEHKIYTAEELEDILSFQEQWFHHKIHVIDFMNENPDTQEAVEEAAQGMCSTI